MSEFSELEQTNDVSSQILKMLFKIVLFVALLCRIECSIVSEVDTQKGIYLSDYCPKMKYCPEGAHIMCMYYNPNSVMGPQCRNFQNVSVTTELANKLLDVINAVRSKLARGNEKGQGGVLFPRGYGIFRLRWDNELATFAQVHANQCVLRHDLCRASKKFPNPGQAVSLVRFTIPDWVPTSKSMNFTSKVLDNPKLMYAIMQSLRNWYNQKNSVTLDMFTNFPNWEKHPNKVGRLYMTMVYGAATHMGCGISAYREYSHDDMNAPLLFNSVLVTCNFSAQPRVGTAVVNTVPPSDTESPLNPCGCPFGSIEDDDCLCLEVPYMLETQPAIQPKASCPSGINCDPTVVLLPIFTVEDAPPSKWKALGSSNSSVGRTLQETKAVDSFEQLFDNSLSGTKGILHQSRKTIQLPPHGVSTGQKQRSLLQNEVTVKNRHFDAPSQHNKITRFDATSDNKERILFKDRHYRTPNSHIIIRRRHFEHQNDAKDHSEAELHVSKPKEMHKSSIFSNTPIFELPGTRYYIETRKRDVVPRKDFSTGKQLVNQYLHNKNGIPIITRKKGPNIHSHENLVIEFKSMETERVNNEAKEHKNNLENHVEDVHFHDILTTETNLNTAEQSLINHNKDIIGLNLFQDYDKLDEKGQMTYPADDNDKKLMALLDTLEQEVKHIELHDKEKQIFDAKIKKIYVEVVGRGTNNLSGIIKPLTVHTTEFNDSSNKADNEVHNLPPSFDTLDEENFIDEPYRKENIDVDVGTEDIERPVIAKSQSLIPYDARPKYTRRSKNNIRNRNQMDSLESAKRRYDNRYKSRKSYKDTIVRNEMGKLKHRGNNLDYRGKNYYGDAYEDPLSNERRKYYQDKLDSMERKLQDVRRYNTRRKEVGRSPHMRAMKPTFRSDNQMNPLYAGRARILHGY